MSSPQNKTGKDEAKDLQGHTEDSIGHLKSAEVDTPKPIIAPSLVPNPWIINPFGAIFHPIYYPVYMVPTGSISSAQEYCTNSSSELQPTHRDIGDITNEHLPNDNLTSCAWLNWQQTVSSASHVRSESPLEGHSPVPSNPALMCRNNLPLISENEISKEKTEDSKSDLSSMLSTQKKNENDEANDLQGHKEDSIGHLKSADVYSPNPIMVSSSVPYPLSVNPFGIIFHPIYYPVYMVPTGSISPAQKYCTNSSSELQSTPVDIEDIPHEPLPNDNLTSCARKQTVSPKPHMRSESSLGELSTVPCDPALLCLNYLPFTSENEISKEKPEESKSDLSSISSDSDDEDCLVVLLNNKL